MIALFLYRFLLILLSPLIFLLIIWRFIKGKEDAERFSERLGKSEKQRPDGPLIWMHGASVGECLSMMPLIEEILKQDKTASVLVTSGTKTSAALLKTRLPERAFHQYIPLDYSLFVRRFLRHWHPDKVLWFESDFWPNLLHAIYKQHIPLVLLNGRVSDRSFARWKKMKWAIKTFLSKFTLVFGQTGLDANRLKELGAEQVVNAGNLKFASKPQHIDKEELKNLQETVADRPFWLCSSTHDNEEEQSAYVHTQLKQHFPNILTILLPRHPERATAIKKMLIGQKLLVAQRSKKEEITPQTDIYLADTMGETSLFFNLSSLVFIGGSLIPFGGQNMLEPMRQKCVTFVGPHTFNFKEIVARSKADGALIEVQNKEELLGNLVQFLKKPALQIDIQNRAFKLATSEQEVLHRVYHILQEKVGFK